MKNVPRVDLYSTFVFLIPFLLFSSLVDPSLGAPAVEGDDVDGGCYYMFNHYGEGDRIFTNEPCLNCTCHNSMLMCYLRVCPFTKPIGQDCTIEKKPDQCCPVIKCTSIEVPVSLVTPSTLTTTTVSSTSLATIPESSTELAHYERGCNIEGKSYPDGAQVESDPSKPCELCYCIRNKTACVMQECILHVEGCQPVFQPGVCCPVRYRCDYLALPDETTVSGLLTTTIKSIFTSTQTPGGCVREGEYYADGSQIPGATGPCEHCYCMRGEIVCAVQECGAPLENEGGNCTAIAPPSGMCCPEKYACDGDKGLDDESAITTTPSSDVDAGAVTLQPMTISDSAPSQEPVQEDGTTVASVAGSGGESQDEPENEDTISEKVGTVSSTQDVDQPTTTSPVVGVDSSTENVISSTEASSLKPSQVSEQETVSHKESGEVTTQPTFPVQQDDDSASADEPIPTTQGPVTSDATEPPKDMDGVVPQKAQITNEILEQGTETPAHVTTSAPETMGDEEKAVHDPTEGPESFPEQVGGVTTPPSETTSPSSEAENMLTSATENILAVSHPPPKFVQAGSETEEIDSTEKSTSESAESASSSTEKPESEGTTLASSTSQSDEGSASGEPISSDDSESSAESGKVSEGESKTEAPSTPTEQPPEISGVDQHQPIVSTSESSPTDSPVTESVPVHDEESGMKDHDEGDATTKPLVDKDSTESPSVTTVRPETDKIPEEESAGGVTTAKPSQDEPTHDEPSKDEPSKDAEKDGATTISPSVSSPGEKDESSTSTPVRDEDEEKKGQEMPQTTVGSVPQEVISDVTSTPVPHGPDSETSSTAPSTGPVSEDGATTQSPDAAGVTEGMIAEKVADGPVHVVPSESSTEMSDDGKSTSPTPISSSTAEGEVVGEMHASSTPDPAESLSMHSSTTTTTASSLPTGAEDENEIGDAQDKISNDDASASSTPETESHSTSSEATPGHTTTEESATQAPSSSSTAAAPEETSDGQKEPEDRVTEQPESVGAPEDQVSQDDKDGVTVISMGTTSSPQAEEKASEATPTEIPTVASSETPDSSSTQRPHVETTDVPEVGSTESTSISSTDAPAVGSTETPVVGPTDAPVVSPTDAPVVSPTDAPADSSADDTDVGSTDAPVVGSTESPSISSTDAPAVGSTETASIASTDAPGLSPVESSTTAPGVLPDQSSTHSPAGTDGESGPADAESSTKPPTPEEEELPGFDDKGTEAPGSESDVTTQSSTAVKDTDKTTTTPIKPDQDEGSATSTPEMKPDGVSVTTAAPVDHHPPSDPEVTSTPKSDTSPVQEEMATEKVDTVDERVATPPSPSQASMDSEVGTTQAPPPAEDDTTIPSSSVGETDTIPESQVFHAKPTEQPETSTIIPSVSPSHEPEESDGQTTAAPGEPRIPSTTTPKPEVVQSADAEEGQSDQPDDGESATVSPTSPSKDSAPDESATGKPTTAAPGQDEPESSHTTLPTVSSSTESVTEQGVQQPTTIAPSESEDATKMPSVSGMMKPDESPIPISGDEEQGVGVTTIQPPSGDDDTSAVTTVAPAKEEESESGVTTVSPPILESLPEETPQVPKEPESHDEPLSSSTEAGLPVTTTTEAPQTTSRPTGDENVLTTIKPVGDDQRPVNASAGGDDEEQALSDSPTTVPTVTDGEEGGVGVTESGKDGESSEKGTITTIAPSLHDDHSTGAPENETTSSENPSTTARPNVADIGGMVHPTTTPEMSDMKVPIDMEEKIGGQGQEVATTSGPTSSDDEDIDDESGPHVPGEGHCFVEGKTYKNGSSIPPTTPCHIVCACQNSIVHCLLVHCNPPPSDTGDCKPIYRQGVCCPTYDCEDNRGEPVTVTPGPIPVNETRVVTVTPETPSQEQEDESTTLAGIASDESGDSGSTSQGQDDSKPLPDSSPESTSEDSVSPVTPATTSTTTPFSTTLATSPGDSSTIPDIIIPLVPVNGTGVGASQEGVETSSETPSSVIPSSSSSPNIDDILGGHLDDPEHNETSLPIPPGSLYPVTTTTTVTPSTAPWPYPTSTPSPSAMTAGACLFDGRVYMSAQQIPRDDPCDFCFCFRGDIICLQQSCPPPIPGCYEEPIPGFCCPRYECPVGNGNVTTEPPLFPPSYYHNAILNGMGAGGGSPGAGAIGLPNVPSGPGCEVQGEYYESGQIITSTSGPCLECRCGMTGMMECDPRECQPEPMLRKMIAAITSR